MTEIPTAPDPQDPQHLPREASPGPRSHLRRYGPATGLLVAGLVAGALGVTVLDHGSTTTAGTAAAQQQGHFPGGMRGGMGGGVAGEVRVSGTLTAVGTSGITVEKADGTTATYTANGTTEVLRDGARSTLSALKTGDAVLVHVIPAPGGGTVAERILAGTSATAPGPGGPPPGTGA